MSLHQISNFYKINLAINCPTGRFHAMKHTTIKPGTKRLQCFKNLNDYFCEDVLVSYSSLEA